AAGIEQHPRTAGEPGDHLLDRLQRPVGTDLLVAQVRARLLALRVAGDGEARDAAAEVDARLRDRGRLGSRVARRVPVHGAGLHARAIAAALGRAASVAAPGGVGLAAPTAERPPGSTRVDQQRLYRIALQWAVRGRAGVAGALLVAPAVVGLA